jgi:dTDP-4-amino-4,6-dideoxygalactose transaminase
MKLSFPSRLEPIRRKLIERFLGDTVMPVSRPSIGQEELQAVGRVFQSGWLGLGSTTFAFEEELKRYLGCRHAIAVNSGTAAIHLALTGFGVGPGDEVIVPSITYVATIQAIIATGATPVFCESHETNLLMDVDDVCRKITDRTKAVIPVHYAGNPCDMDRLLTLAKRYGFWVIEDAAHAFASNYKNRMIGSFGHATCFSFGPMKVVTCGEGGAVVLNDDDVAENIRRGRVLGIENKETSQRYKDSRTWFYEVVSPGYRYHMPNFCAAVGLVQLRKLPDFLKRRREICHSYNAAFKRLRTVRILDIDYHDIAPQIYTLRVINGARDQFIDFLKDRSIGTGIHYIANHLHPYFRQYVCDGLPLSSRLWREIVTLPLYVDMTDDAVQMVIEAVVAFNERHAASLVRSHDLEDCPEMAILAAPATAG